MKKHNPDHAQFSIGRRSLLFAPALLLLSGCAVNQAIGYKIRGGKDLGKIEIGMTKEQVREIFGKPKSASVHGRLESWNYGRNKIRFTDGRVSSYM